MLKQKKVQLPQDWFGTPTWPQFHCFKFLDTNRELKQRRF